MSKYPNFDRVTAGRLAVGDTILVRDGAQDHQWVEQPRWVGGARQGGVALAHGTHKVIDIDIEMHQAGRKMSRYYNVMLEGGSVVKCSSVQRWNRVVS